jgi:hypothetical protein
VANSKNTQALKDSTEDRWPGVTVYTVGDDAHKQESSDHNNDDTPGVVASQSDTDKIPEVRATDTMIGKNFTAADAENLFVMLTTRPENQARLAYVIYNRRIRSHNDSPPWSGKAYTRTDPHTNHVHSSTLAAKDDVATPFNLGAAGMTTADTDGIKAILSGTGSGTLNTPNNLHVKLNKLSADIAAVLKVAEAAAGRSDGILGMDDVITTWSDVSPAGKETNELAKKLNSSTTNITLTPDQLDKIVAQVTAAVVTALKTGAFVFEELEAHA